jgi:hypothetical protein
MNRTFENSRGQRFHSGAGGTYPINNGDPQNDLEDESDDEDLDIDDDDITGPDDEVND